MATHRITILGFNLVPDSSGDVFFEPYDIKATNDLYKKLVAIFNDTSTKLSLFGTFKVPKNYVGSAKIGIEWTSTATSGNTVWDFDYTAVGGNDSESLDPSGHQESVTVTDAAPTAANRKLTAEMSLTSSNLAADDEVEFLLSRDGADGSDTMAAAAQIHNAYFEYADA